MKRFHKEGGNNMNSRKADIGTIALKCGVSRATVSRVFTGKAAVSEPLREKILRAARTLNYSPQQTAVRETIALVVDSLESLGKGNGFQEILLAQLVAEITRSGFHLNIVEAEDTDRILDSYTKAAVILLNDVQYAKYRDSFRSLKMPLISVGNLLENCHGIFPDYHAETVSAVEHLIESGHRKITIVLDSLSNLAGKERLRGYRETMKKHGFLPLSPSVFRPREQSLIELLALMMKDGPTATVLCGESLPNEAVYAFQLLHLRIPDDLSVISFEKKDCSRWFCPPHTTIDQDVSEMASGAMSILRQVIDRCPGKLLQKLLPCRLVVRNSVRILEN